MKLRPHHAMCIQKFTGHGYDGAFTEHMTRVVSELRGAPGTVIEVVRGCDELCGACPNNADGGCTSAEKVTRLDEDVMGACVLSYGQRIRWDVLAESAKKQIFNTDRFSQICARCQWFSLCVKTEVDDG